MSFRRNLDWVPVVGYGSQESYVATVPVDNLYPIQSRLLLTPADDIISSTLSQPTGTPNIHQTVTAKRVRGSALFGISMPVSDATIGRTLFLIHERVHMGVYDLSDGSVATPVDSFIAGGDANERFLWERHMTYDVTTVMTSGSASIVWLNRTGRAATIDTTTGGALTHPFWSDIDVQANRRLNEGECLLYSVQYQFIATGTPSATNFPVMHSLAWLRTLTRV